MKRNTEEHANTSKAREKTNKQNNNENQKSSNGDHSPNVFRQTSLLFHKWLAERFNLDDA